MGQRPLEESCDITGQALPRVRDSGHYGRQKRDITLKLPVARAFLCNLHSSLQMRPVVYEFERVALLKLSYYCPAQNLVMGEVSQEPQPLGVTSLEAIGQRLLTLAQAPEHPLSGQSSQDFKTKLEAKACLYVY